MEPDETHATEPAPPRNRGGRPRLASDVKRGERFTVNLTPGERLELAREATARGLTLSELARRRLLAPWSAE